ncbi:MAG: hypothetical protein ABWY71_02395 [Candidatus Saccharimonadales bacterium]
MKIHTVEGRPIGIISIDPTVSEELLIVRARQVSSFMRRVVQPYYEVDLGLTRIDTAPRPDPFDDEHIRWRAGRMRPTGPVERAGLEFIGAFYFG